MTISASCHCKNIQLRIASLPEELSDCDCSICRRYSALWGYYLPEEVSVEHLRTPPDSYIWGDRAVEFIRCGDCGCITHYVTTQLCAEQIIAVNFRLFEPSIIETIPVKKLCNATPLKDRL